jgi:hypothetical protein
MQAIEIEAQIDDNAEIHLRLPHGLEPGPARVIVLIEAREAVQTGRSRHEPPSELAWQGAELHGDDIAPAFTPEEWGDLHQ